MLIDEIEFADVILLNKTDLIEEEDSNKLTGVLRKLNPHAKIFQTSHS
nr:GTP-binding protein [Rossellomorea vietnamensis]